MAIWFFEMIHSKGMNAIRIKYSSPTVAICIYCYYFQTRIIKNVIFGAKFF